MNHYPFVLWFLVMLGSAAVHAQPAPSAVDGPASAAATSTAPEPTSAAPVLTRPPELVEFVEAPFPESERKSSSNAVVILELQIHADGTVGEVRVLESGGVAFDEAALEAVRRFRFNPAQVDGVDAAIKIQYRYTFRLEPAEDESAEPQPAILSGIVRDQLSQSPLALVQVRLSTGAVTTTDQTGRFRFEDVPPGEHTVILSGPTLSPLQATETVRAGARLEVVYDLVARRDARDPGANAEEVVDLEVLVVAPKLTHEVVATRVEAQSARRVPGTQGDVLKVVESMPGVARASAGSGDVVVWGAAPGDTRVYIDQVRVPALYHFGGFRSIMHSDLVRSVELIPGAYGASYGRGLGGLITVESLDPSEEGPTGSVQVDALDAAAATHGWLGPNVAIALGGRRSHLDELVGNSLDQGSGQILPLPRYRDASARVRTRAGANGWVELGGLWSRDELTRGVSAVDPRASRSEHQEQGFERVFIRYRSETDDGQRITLVPWFGRDVAGRVGEFGGVPVSIESKSFLYGLRSNWTGEAAPNAIAQLGFDFEFVDGTFDRRGSLGAPAREGDARVFGQPPADQVNLDRWHAVTGSAAPYAELDLALLDGRLHVTPGLRVEPFFSSVNRRRPARGNVAVGAFDSELTLQPRLALRYELDPKVTLKAAFGRYHQPAPAEDLSAVFGNPALGTARATHALLGADTAWSDTLGTEVTVFISRSQDLAARNPAREPRVAEALVATGQGRAYGMQLLLRRELADGFLGWVAYTLLRSERKDPGRTTWRLSDLDQTHVLTALASYDLGAGFEVGARLRVASGAPRTSVIDTYYDALRDRYEPVLGERNGARLPTFAQLDARVTKRWKLGSSELEAYLDVLNITNRANVEELAYSADYRQEREIHGLPLLPVLGARWSF